MPAPTGAVPVSHRSARRQGRLCGEIAPRGTVRRTGPSMSTARLLLLLMPVLVAVVIVLFVLRRGAARRDAQRVEAAGLRSVADAMVATGAGQSAFAGQAPERAELAR